MLSKSVFLYSSWKNILLTMYVFLTMLTGWSANKKVVMQNSQIPSLKKVFENDFLVGTAMSASEIAEKDKAKLNPKPAFFSVIATLN